MKAQLWILPLVWFVVAFILTKIWRAQVIRQHLFWFEVVVLYGGFLTALTMVRFGWQASPFLTLASMFICLPGIYGALIVSSQDPLVNDYIAIRQKSFISRIIWYYINVLTGYFPWEIDDSSEYKANPDKSYSMNLCAESWLLTIVPVLVTIVFMVLWICWLYVLLLKLVAVLASNCFTLFIFGAVWWPEGGDWQSWEAVFRAYGDTEKKEVVKFPPFIFLVPILYLLLVGLCFQKAWLTTSPESRPLLVSGVIIYLMMWLLVILYLRPISECLDVWLQKRQDRPPRERMSRWQRVVALLKAVVSCPLVKEQ